MIADHPLADRPDAATVPAGTIFPAADVPEAYVSDGTSWVLLPGAGEEIGYAESYPMVNYTGDGDPIPIPGLSVTFLAGIRPVVVHVALRLASQISGSRADASIRLDGTEVARIEQTAVASDKWQSESLFRRLPRLDPGTTHTVEVLLTRGLGTGTVRTAGDPTNPNTLQVVTS